MSPRSIYLTKHRASANQRAHFSIFVPTPVCDRANLSQDFKSQTTIGTVIHVVGEPVMAGYILEFKRNYECSTSRELRELILLDRIDEACLYDPPNRNYSKDNTARGILEREAALVPPPPRGQNIRAPVDGVSTKRCQEWTMEFLQRLVRKGIISQAALDRANAQRDPPNLGIFGQRNLVPGQQGRPQPPAASISRTCSQEASGSWIFDNSHRRYKRWDGRQWVWR